MSDADSTSPCPTLATNGRHGRAVDHTGKEFGRLTVIRFAGHIKNKLAWLCRCSCGVEKVVRAEHLVGGRVVSCGCWKDESTSKRRRTHGMSKTTVYRIWKGMIRRATSTTSQDYEDYAGRGITICRRWRESFEDFYADMGDRPTKRHSIDRKDNDGSYSCGQCDECQRHGWTANCRWATPHEQGLNKRLTKWATLDGVTKRVAEWCIELGIKERTVRARIERNGMTPEQALTKPLRVWPGTNRKGEQ